MAVGAATIEIANRVKQSWSSGVAAGDVAGITDARHPNFQQLRVICPVRFMAVGAVFHDRRMLPQERTATLGVAAIAVLIGCCLQQLMWIRRAVRVVAACAGYFAFAIRHVRRAFQLRASHQVACEAKLRLLFLRLHLGKRGVEPRIG